MTGDKAQDRATQDPLLAGSMPTHLTIRRRMPMGQISTSWLVSAPSADVVEPNKRASAIAFMFTGLTLATVTGVPLGTFIGQVTDWRMSFIFIVIIGIIGLISNALLVPNQLSKGNPISLRDIGKVLGNIRMLLILFITAIGYGGAFVVYTYVSPILEQYMGYSPHAVVIILVV